MTLVQSELVSEIQRPFQSMFVNHLATTIEAHIFNSCQSAPLQSRPGERHELVGASLIHLGFDGFFQLPARWQRLRLRKRTWYCVKFDVVRLGYKADSQV